MGQNTLLQISLKNTKCPGTIDYFTIACVIVSVNELVQLTDMEMSSFIFHQNKTNKESLGDFS